MFGLMPFKPTPMKTSACNATDTMIETCIGTDSASAAWIFKDSGGGSTAASAPRRASIAAAMAWLRCFSIGKVRGEANGHGRILAVCRPY